MRYKREEHITGGRSRVLDMRMRTGVCPLSLLVVSLGLSLRRVWPPTMTASDRARVSKTFALAAGEVTHALCPEEVAILPSRVMAYFRMPRGLPLTTLCSRACKHSQRLSEPPLACPIEIISRTIGKEYGQVRLASHACSSVMGHEGSQDRYIYACKMGRGRTSLVSKHACQVSSRRAGFAMEKDSFKMSTAIPALLSSCSKKKVCPWI